MFVKGIRVTRSVSRRSLLGASGLAAAAIAAPRLTSAQTPDASPTGPWTFTDDKGVTVTLDTMPTRIIADVNAAAPLWDFGIRPVGVFGWNATQNKDFGPAGGNIDPDQVEVVGYEPELFVYEKAAALNPDLIITVTWEPDNPAEYWSLDFDPDLIETARAAAPVIAISATGSADVNTERFAELAASLGANLESDEQIAAKERFETAKARLQGVASAKSDLVSLFAYLGDGAATWYIASPQDWADLSFYQSLGVTMVQPDVEKFAYWNEISTEEADMYPADIFFHSTRPGTTTEEALIADESFGSLPSIKAGQVAAWNQDFIMSYEGMAIATEGIAAAIEQATKVS